MPLRSLLVMALNDLKRKANIAILILLSISSIFLFIIVRWNFTHTLADEYSDRQDWPAEIEIYKYVNESGDRVDLGSIVDDVREIEGVKWVVYPGGGIWIDDAFNYHGKNYSLLIGWCNVEDPMFPHPKFIVEGRFFKLNDENAVIIDMIARKLLEDLGLFHGIGTKVQILGENLTIIGVVGNPMLYGGEEQHLKLTDTIYFYVPLNTYLNLTSIALSPPYINSINVFVLKEIYVKVDESYSVDEVAREIRERFPGIGMLVVTESKRSLLRSITLESLIQGLIFYLLSGMVMLWSVRYEKKEIFLLKALGWRVRDILRFFTLRNVILGIFSAVIGTFLALVVGILPTPYINLYIIYTILLPFPFLLPMVVSAVLIFSLPSIYWIYRVSSGEYIRS